MQQKSQQGCLNNVRYARWQHASQGWSWGASM